MMDVFRLTLTDDEDANNEQGDGDRNNDPDVSAILYICALSYNSKKELHGLLR